MYFSASGGTIFLSNFEGQCVEGYSKGVERVRMFSPHRTHTYEPSGQRRNVECRRCAVDQVSGG